MNTNDLIRKLNSVGKQAFVEHFDLFRKYASGQISRNEAINTLVVSKVSNEAGAGRRVSNAKLIFKANREADALGIILESKRMPATVINEAKRLIGGGS